MKTSLSVIVPTYNAGHYIAGCIRNIRSQSASVSQILVVDDGSTDETARVVAEHHDITYIHQENRGPSAARNRGLKEADGDLVTFLDVDDLWPHDGLSALLQSMDDATDVALGKVQCLIRSGTDGGSGFERFGDPFVAFNIGAALYRKEVFERVGSFDESLFEGEDVDWFLRAREAGIRIKHVDDTTLLYRRREGSITYGRQSGSETLARMLKRSLDRRRRTASGNAVAVGHERAERDNHDDE